MKKAGSKRRPEPHYFSQRLMRKLGRIPALRSAVVEAPSGYGKTTAVKDFLEALPEDSAQVRWLTAVDEAPASLYRRLCAVIQEIDPEAGRRLWELGLPNAATLGDACDLVRSVACQKETILVLDNFQYLQEALPQDFQQALVEHGPGLHLVIIAQRLTDGMRQAAAGRGAMTITAGDLRLTREDIQAYGRLAGKALSDQDAEKIHRYTEGWMIAVCLQLNAYRETGEISGAPDIPPMMERLAWDPLSEGQREFLLKLSPLEAVTARQAAALAGLPALTEAEWGALACPFIRCARQEGRYELHAILREVLEAKRRERGAAFERACLVGAGDLLLSEGAADRALKLYLEAGDLERALSMDLAPLIFERIGGEPFPAVAPRILRGCPEALRRKYPLAMLQLAWALLAAGDGAAFDDLMEELRAAPGDGPEGGALMGEWLLLACWRKAPDLPAMLELVRRAEPLLAGRRSRVILPGAPWCFGNFSQFSAFHASPGAADREADQLEAFVRRYAPLTGGHGSGADALFRAELAHYRGDLGQAEVLLHKASLLSEASRQSIVQLGAKLHLAEIAVEKADMALWQRTIAGMERAASGAGHGGFVLPATVELVRSVLFIELGYPKRITPWLREGETAGRILPAAENVALFARLNCLMHEFDLARLAGMAEAGLAALREGDVLMRALLSLQAGVGRLWLGSADQAAALIGRAAEISLPDGLVHLFAAYDTEALKGMAEGLIRAQYPSLLDRFLAVKARFSSGYGALHEGVVAADLPRNLTAREREVALLAALGLRNGEIAQKVGASENTVRTHLRVVYQKMGIDRRARLAERLR